MKKIPSILAVLALIFFSSSTVVFAKEPENEQKTADITARVGEFSLNISGIIAPYASLSIVSGGNVYKSIAADSNGNFSFSDILINRGFSDFCIAAIDWKRLGESYTCFSVPPATANITMTDIFLSPTLGINKREVPEGSDVLISGYTMPGSDVKVHINSGVVLSEADFTGHYYYTYTDIKKGSYELYAGSTYEGKISLMPHKKFVLHVISLGEYWMKLGESLMEWLLSHLYLFVIPSLIVLIMLISFIIWREPILIKLHMRQKKLHHAWMVGY